MATSWRLVQKMHLTSFGVRLLVRASFNLARPPLSLLPFQQQGVKRLLQDKRLLLADEMGVGKTIQCVAAINRLLHKDDATILIVCTKSLMSMWNEELEKWLEPKLDIQIASTKSFPLPSPGSITVINYDICDRFRDELKLREYDVLICDEAHLLKNRRAKRTRAILGNGQISGISSEYLWLLTGTPVLNREEELFSLLRAIDPREFSSFSEFRNTYCVPKPGCYLTGGETATDDYFASKLEKLSRQLLPYMLRRLKKDVLPQLPPKECRCVFLEGPVDVAEDERERLMSRLASVTTSDGVNAKPQACDSMKSALWNSVDGVAEGELERTRPIAAATLKIAGSKSANTDLESHGSMASALLKYAEDDQEGSIPKAGLESHGSMAPALLKYLEKCTGIDVGGQLECIAILGHIATVRRETALAKVPPTIEILKVMILYGKVVVFAHHRAVIRALGKQFGNQAVCVMGGTTVAERENAVRSFQEDPDVRLFVGSTKMAGVGLTLTAASDVVFLELDYSPAIMTQAEDRCHRIGQFNDVVNVQYLVFKGTLDEWLANLLLFKQERINQIFPERFARVTSGYVFNFGKHKGKALEEIYDNYIQWLIRKEIWRQRPDLERALRRTGYLCEEPRTRLKLSQQQQLR